MQPVKALAKNPNPKPQPITTAGDQFFIRLAAELRGELSNSQLANAYTRMNAWVESLDALTKNVRERILDLLKGSGTQVTEKGALEYEDNGWILRARPWRTGYDSKKVEALLRAKGADVARWMDADVKYKVNQTKLGGAMQAGVLTDAELETCRDGRDEQGNQIYALDKPKRADE